MKILSLIGILMILTAVTCTLHEEALICHVYGWVRNEADSVTGISNLTIQIKDINPEHVEQYRIRETTTGLNGALPGFFEMDSVCYGTTNQQGTGYVTIFADSLDNPGWQSRLWVPSIIGDTDTIILYLAR